MSASGPPLTLGTAGHIDHGKSSLAAALSGARTDRLPEEQARGMTIALGYAELRLPDGRALSLIDVPGHERFVRTMVSGATGIDLFLLVVAADDGVMPQTTEHLRVLEALDVRHGVVAVTKSDLADPGPAAEQVRPLLPGIPVVSCSTRTMEGIDDVGRALAQVAGRVSSRAAPGGGCVLHVDRVFSVRGAGTVLTGTLWSGSVARGQRLQLLPGSRPVRVRGVQVHDRAVEEAEAGQRVAVNLTGLAREDVARGDVLASPDTGLHVTYRLDLALRLHEPQARTERVQVHHGTRESPARLVALGEDYWQARLERPLVARAGDRVVLRSISIPDTLGGGLVLDADPRRHGPSAALLDRLERLRRGEQVEATAAPDRQPQQRRAPASLPAPAPVLGEPALELERRLRAAGTRPPSDAELGEDARYLPELRAAGRIVRVGRSMHAHVEAIEQLSELVGEIILTEGSLTLARLRDELGSSRRYAQALLEHLDAARVTLRLPDDRRVLRRDSARGKPVTRQSSRS
jgi:selenocysteine-specific elongation factor